MNQQQQQQQQNGRMLLLFLLLNMWAYPAVVKSQFIPIKQNLQQTNNQMLALLKNIKQNILYLLIFIMCYNRRLIRKRFYFWLKVIKR